MDRIRELREEKGISMREAAKRLHMPYTTYVNYEKGLREPSSEVLIALARFFNVTIDYLVGNVNDPEFYLDNERILREINSYSPFVAPGYEKAPTGGERKVTDEDIKFALFGGDGEITDAMYDEVRQFAAFVKNREAQKKKELK